MKILLLIIIFFGLSACVPDSEELVDAPLP